MALTRKDLLYQLAEETAYSFKGHMKTADGYGFTLACFIAVPLLTSLLILIWDIPLVIQRIAGAAGFLFSALALNSTLATNKEKADKTIEAHTDLGNKYLALYGEIKVAATNIESLDQAKLDYFQKRIAELNTETTKLRITFIGRWWSKLAIEKEMDVKWLHEDR